MGKDGSLNPEYKPKVFANPDQLAQINPANQDLIHQGLDKIKTFLNQHQKKVYVPVDKTPKPDTSQPDPAPQYTLGAKHGSLADKQFVSATDKLEEETLIDHLTGLYNRRFFEQQVSKMANGHYSVGFIVLDYDLIKKINDELGHQIGDDKLKAVAEILRQSFRDTDVISRMGEKSDEYHVLMSGENLTEETMIQHLQKLNQNIEAYNSTHPDSTPISISVGYSFLNQQQFTINDLEKNTTLMKETQHIADTLMYQMKEQHHAINSS